MRNVSKMAAEEKNLTRRVIDEILAKNRFKILSILKVIRNLTSTTTPSNDHLLLRWEFRAVRKSSHIESSKKGAELTAPLETEFPIKQVLMSSQLIFLTTGQHFKTGLSRNGINQFLSDYCSRLFYFCEKLRGDLQYNKKKTGFSNGFEHWLFFECLLLSTMYVCQMTISLIFTIENVIIGSF